MGDDTCSSIVEMNAYETLYENNTIYVTHKSVCGVPSYGRCVSVQKSSKRWKRKHHYFQQRAREERLNKNKKWKGEVPPEGLNLKKMYKAKETRKQEVSVSQTTEDSVDSICLDDNDQLLEGSVIISEAEENSLKANLSQKCHKPSTDIANLSQKYSSNSR